MTQLAPVIVQKQYDLQFDLINELLLLDEESVTLKPDLRQKITDLKNLSIEIQRSPQSDVSVADESTEESFWVRVLAELLKQGVEYALGWFNPGAGVSLFNASGSAIFVRTYDQRDNLRWIPYGSWTIQPNSYATIYARGDSYIQADLKGRIFRCPIGAPQAYDGSGIQTKR